MDLKFDLKEGLKAKDPKTWVLVGSGLILVALLAKFILIVGLVIIGVVAYNQYKEKKK